MKRIYIFAGTVLVLPILAWWSGSEGDSALDKDKVMVAINELTGTADLTLALDMLVSNKPIPKTPVKDLFANPADERVRQVHEELINVNDTLPPKKEEQVVTSFPELFGVVIRQSESRAFFIDNGETYALKVGDVLAGRYRISEISPVKVNIREVSTGLSKNIYIKNEQ